MANINKPGPTHVSAPRKVRNGDAEVLITFIEKIAGRRLYEWEAGVIIRLSAFER